MKGFAYHGAQAARIFIRVDTTDPQVAVATAVRVGARLRSNRSLGLIAVFLRVNRPTGWIAPHACTTALTQAKLRANNREQWQLQSFWQNDNVTLRLVDPDEVDQPAAF